MKHRDETLTEFTKQFEALEEQNRLLKDVIAAAPNKFNGELIVHARAATSIQPLRLSTVCVNAAFMLGVGWPMTCGAGVMIV